MLKPAAPAVVQAPTHTHMFIPGQPSIILGFSSKFTPKGAVFYFLISTCMFAACRAHQEGDHIRGHLQSDVPAAAQAAPLLPPCCGSAHSPHHVPRYCLSPCPGSVFHNSQVLPFTMSRQCLSPFPCTAFHDVQALPFMIPMYCLS